MMNNLVFGFLMLTTSLFLSACSQAKTIKSKDEFYQNEHFLEYHENKAVCKAVKDMISTVPTYKERNKNKEIKSRRFFVGRNIAYPTPEDYTLDIISFDVSNDDREDLIATDWMPYLGRTFYQAIYIYPNQGWLFDGEEKLLDFFINKKYLLKHNEGEIPLIPVRFTLIEKKSNPLNKNKSTLGQYYLANLYPFELIAINGKNYLLFQHAKEEKEILVFDININNRDVKVICK